MDIQTASTLQLDLVKKAFFVLIKIDQKKQPDHLPIFKSIAL